MSTSSPLKSRSIIVLLFGICCHISHQKQITKRDTIMNKSCIAAEQIGINMGTLPHDIIHSIHIMTVEDVKFYLGEESFTEENNIPVMNPDLFGPTLFYDMPSVKSEFEFPALRLFDWVLSNTDNQNGWIIEGTINTGMIAHGAHMHEMWMDIGKRYKEILKDPPATMDHCPCLVEDQHNCILEFTYLLAKLDELGANVNPDPKFRGIREPGFDPGLPKPPPRCPEFVYGDTKEVNMTDGNVLDGVRMPVITSIAQLKDKESWLHWKLPMLSRNLDAQEIFNSAMYLFCKIHFKWGKTH